MKTKIVIRPEVAFLFEEKGAKAWLARPRLPRFNAILPKGYSDKPGFNPDNYVYSGDREALLITEELGDRLTREFPASTDENGWAGANAVPSDFHNVRNVSGYGSDPLPIPLMDNAKFVKSLGLRDSIRAVDLPWFKELVRLFFGHVAPQNLHIRKDASTGFPYFTPNVQYKKLGTLKCLHNIDDWLNATSSGREGLVRAFDQYDTVFVQSINERQQPNRIIWEDGKWRSKDRNAPTPEEARTGNFEGKRTANMTVEGPSGPISGHFAMRRRAVFGMSGIPNYVMTAIMGCHRVVYLNRFAFTYKTRDAADKERKIANYKWLVGSDVKSMDTTIPQWFFDLLLEELHTYWDERLVTVLRRMLYAPYVVPPPYRETPDGYDPVFGGSPLEPSSFDTHVGLPSGIFINPDLGKLWMSLCT